MKQQGQMEKGALMRKTLHKPNFAKMPRDYAELMVMSGKRGLSKANIRRLAEHFKVLADYFL